MLGGWPPVVAAEGSDLARSASIDMLSQALPAAGIARQARSYSDSCACKNRENSSDWDLIPSLLLQVFALYFHGLGS